MPAQSPAAFGRALAKENPEGLPRGDVQGVIEARFGFNTPEDREALAAWDEAMKTGMENAEFERSRRTVEVPDPEADQIASLGIAQENERLKATNAALLAALDAWVAHTGGAPQLGGNLAAIDHQIRAAIANARGA